MRCEVDDIDIYRQSSLILLKRVPSKIHSWVTITMISLILFGLIATFVKYDKYLVYDAVINDSLIEINVDKLFFESSNQKMKINGEFYKYKINKIEPYIYQNNKGQYWKLTISSPIPKDWIIDNNYIQIHFYKGKTTFLKETIKFIKKGMIN